jgi:aryl-alcohol dehydrogenase-like predicted oxidoreductase
VERVRFGSTELEVSPLCLGTYVMSGAWGGAASSGLETVGHAFDRGINFFDTAYAYGGGVAEHALAAGLGDLLSARRDEIVITTKGGLAMSELPGGGVSFGPDSSPAFLRASLINSLKRLGTDYVDIYLIHWYDPVTPIEESAVALRSFVEEGLVRYIGVSNYSVAQMEAFTAVAKLDVAQVPFNLFAQYTADAVLPYCQDHRIGVMGYSAVAQGFLTGRFEPEPAFATEDWRAHSPEFQGDRYRSRMDAVARLSPVAERVGCSLAQLAVAWVQAHSAGVVPIVGTRSSTNLDEIVGATGVALTREDVQEVGRIGKSAIQVDYADRVE